MAVEEHEAGHAAGKADGHRKEGQFPHMSRIIERRYEQAPKGRRHHDAGGKARQEPLHALMECITDEKDTGGAQGRA